MLFRLEQNMGRKQRPYLLRTYGTLFTGYPIFYPYYIPNWIFLNNLAQCLKTSMNNTG